MMLIGAATSQFNKTKNRTASHKSTWKNSTAQIAIQDPSPNPSLTKHAQGAKIARIACWDRASFSFFFFDY